MVAKILVFLIVVLHGAFLISGVLGQSDYCVPAAVEALEILSNATLQWRPNADDGCEITQYQVDIFGDSADEYHIRVTETHVDLYFLEICEEWIFTVTAFSHDVLGFGKTLKEFIPLPPDADLSLSYFNVTSLGDRDVLLEWDLVNHTHGDCSLHYRLSVEDEELGIAQDVYVQGSTLHLTFLSPCVPYQLGIRAVNKAHPYIEGPLRRTEFTIDPKPQRVPTLQITDIQATTATLTWVPEGGSNRCPLRALYVESANHFNISLPLQNSLFPEPVPIELKSLRPNSMYFLRVYVQNSGGFSTPSQLGIQTLELSPD